VRVNLAGRNHRGWVHIPPEAPAARVPASMQAIMTQTVHSAQSQGAPR
jgi:hypothetical protein